tara:strand:- start:1025 stop:2839 length:1815 start_codon:yes stop_codon:yes gene_type:complete
MNLQDQFMKNFKQLVKIVFLLCLITNCSNENHLEDESQNINEILDGFFMELLKVSPESMTYLGIKDRYGEWDDISDDAKDRELEILKSQLKKALKIDLRTASDSEKLSVKMFIDQLERRIEADKWRYHNYPVNQMRGKHSQIPSFLINQHSIDNENDARAYIDRVKAVPIVIDELINQLEIRAKKEIIIPNFVFPLVIESIDNILSGHPFSKGENSPLYEDFSKKISQINLSVNGSDELLYENQKALKDHFEPSYKKLKNYLLELKNHADDRDGVWKLPEGESFYNFLLKGTTTTNLDSNQIHQIGLDEVARIQQEMGTIMTQVEFDGTLQEFFSYLQNDESFYYDNTEAGKKAYIKKATEYIDHMGENLDKLFYVAPKAKMIVKAVEPFREASAGQAFYQRPAPDGSRPGVYFANLYNMKNMSKFNMQALAYHEGIPGHHMQISIAQELQDIPKFRLYGGFTVFNEGWALYSEAIPAELGFYTDPFSNFGRLAGELYRACRLVVDTGIHVKKWSREKAIDYMNANVPHSKNYNVRQIERYVVMPSQATAYKIGMIKIQELRKLAESKLDDKFDIRAFHDVVLKHGSVTMPILEENVKKWISNQ